MRHSELRSQFSRMQSLRVTARSSFIAFRDEALDAVTIAQKLAVAAQWPTISTCSLGEDLFRSAIRSDPKFAQAHASLAGVLLWQALNTIDEASNAEQVAALDREVMPDIERARALDP